MYHIIKDSRPTNDKTFATIEDALEYAVAPKSASDTRSEYRELEHTFPNTVMTIEIRGMFYSIRKGENPAQARREHRAEVAQTTTMATAKQMSYLNSLAARVPASAADHWVKDGMTKQEASRAINALQDMAQA